MYLFKLKGGITFLYEVDFIPYKGFKYIVLKNTLVDNEKVQRSTLRSGNFSLTSGYFTKTCEYNTLDEVIEKIVKFKKQHMLISAIFHNDGTY